MTTFWSILTVVGALVLSAGGGWLFTRTILRLADRPGTEDGPTSDAATAALRGGTWIGVLERLAISGTIMLGYPAGIAAVIAVKGLGRFAELKDNSAASERFVIGSLASLLWGIALGFAGLGLLIVIHR